jgi:hypothetical protein
LVAAEVWLAADPRPLRERWPALRPCGLLLVVVVLAFVAIRTDVVGAFAGDRPNVVLEHLAPAARRWTMLGVVPEWIRLLVWPSHLAAEYAPRAISLHDGFDRTLLIALVLLTLVAALFLLAARWWHAAAFGLAWVAVTLLLVSNLVVPTGVLLAERTLFLPSVGAMLFVATALSRSMSRLGRDGRTGVGVRLARTAAAAIIVATLMAGIWRSARRQLVWRSNATLFAQAPIDAPSSYRAHDVYAGLLFDRHDAAGGEREAHLALALYRHDPLLYRDLAQEYMHGGMCRAAIPLLKQSIAEQGSMQTDARLLLAECLLAQHEPAAARAEVLRGMADGYYPFYGPGYHRVLLSVDSALASGGEIQRTEPRADTVAARSRIMRSAVFRGRGR